MFIYLDTETTESGTTVDELYNPNMPISVEAMSIHHITNEMVADKPLFKGNDACKKLLIMFASDDAILVAHNAKFDVSIRYSS